jgi:hypothetical protein
MRINQQYSIIVIFLVLCGLLTTRSAAHAQSNSYLKLDAKRISWTRLSFHAKNFWVEVSTDIQMKSLPASDLDAVLLASPKGTPIKPQTSQINEMTINTIIDPRFRSPVKIHNRVWFNPADASALGRIRLRRGEDDFKKMYRFTDQGVFRHRMEPKDKKEVSLEPEQWTDIKDSFYPYDRPNLGCNAVSERSLLIYILSAVPLVQNNNPLSLCVFGKRALHWVTLQKTGIRSIPINYIKKKWQVETPKKGHARAIEVAISAETFESSQTPDEIFSFLGFQKDISIHIDSVSHLPIHISGTIPTVGKTHLRLNKVEMKR